MQTGVSRARTFFWKTTPRLNGRVICLNGTVIARVGPIERDSDVKVMDV